MFLFILFIYECTELGESKVVITVVETDKRLIFNVLLFERVDKKNVLHLIYSNLTVLE